MTSTATVANALDAGTRLRFPTLSVVDEGGDYVVGDPRTTTFIAVPEAGLLVLRELQAGRSVGEATATVSNLLGQNVDVLDFASSLLAIGLATEIDRASLTMPPDLPWGQAPRSLVYSNLTGLLYSRVAWVIYLALAGLSIAIFSVYPAYWPSFEDFFFYPDPAISIATIAAASLLLTGGHELSHWSAARAVGVRASLSISLRMYFPVLEADLSELWALPRARRYSALLAGMAFDVVILAGSLALRVAAADGLLDLPPFTIRCLAALTLVQITALAWQFLVFLRTDMYAVMVTALGCRNLARVTHLSVKSMVVSLSVAELAEYDTAHSRDRSVARWFRLLYLGGFALAAWFFVVYFIPSTALVGGWMLASLASMSIGTSAFWEAAAVAAVSVANLAAPLAIRAWQRHRGRTAR